MSESEWLTIAEMARRLGTTEPRLRRILQREEFSEYTRQQERHTRTGTRTGTVVSVSVLPRLREAFEKGSTQQPEHKREREQSEALSLSKMAALYSALAAEKDARIRQQENEINHLRGEVEFLRKQVEGKILQAAPSEPMPVTTGQAETTQTGGQAETDTRRPWWQIWRR